jgi:hypothetical protein
MNSPVTERISPRTSEPAADIERELETWDWVRTAGVSAQDLRKAVRESVGRDES